MPEATSNVAAFDPARIAREWVAFNKDLLSGVDNLLALEDEDIRFGLTPKEEVAREENIVLYRYTPVVAKPHPVPLLISYALVNRPYMVDLQSDRSLVKSLLEQGVDVYLIDWGYPRRVDRFRTLDDYVNFYLDHFVDVVRERHGLDAINLLGICQGGVFSMCYGALHGDKVKNLVTMVAPVDFHTEEGLLNRWAGCTWGSEAMDVDLMVDAMGNIDGDFMNYGYLMLRPFSLGMGKYVDLVSTLNDPAKLENFLRMEKWIFDSPDQAGEAYRQFMKDFYQGNKLIRGEVELGGRRVSLGELKMPILNIYAEQDHLVPPASSRALRKFVGTKDYTERSFPVGHIGMYVSGKVQKDLPPLIASWLKER
jgi:polyhydroxyalkanoate synthase subunit PhaC